MKTQKNEVIILPDSPESAKQVTKTLWESKNGNLFISESSARWDGATHAPCKKCSLPTEKPYTICDKCKQEAEVEKYNKLPKKEWDGEGMIYSQADDTYFTSLDDAEFSLEDGRSLADLQLLICEPVYAHPLDYDYFCDEMADDQEVPEDLLLAVEEFNKKIEAYGPLSWSPGKFAVKLEGLENGQ